MNLIYTNVLCKGNRILYRGYDSNFQRIQKSSNFAPSLFVPSQKESKWKSLEGENLEEINFPSINECRDFIKDYMIDL